MTAPVLGGPGLARRLEPPPPPEPVHLSPIDWRSAARGVLYSWLVVMGLWLLAAPRLDVDPQGRPVPLQVLPATPPTGTTTVEDSPMPGPIDPSDPPWPDGPNDPLPPPAPTPPPQPKP